ncbi:hypothetical protein FBR05_04505 [Deltaproteobacteria bacterium PRO3]|nr:hypothetical protein [Deltaproteobacteria bacterium PRO3]
MFARTWRRSAGAWALVLAVALAALPQRAASETACAIHSAQELVACALERHPDLAVAAQAEARDRTLPDIARQRPNPELDSRILGGKSADDSLVTTETTLFTVWELGGKRRSRVAAAQAQGRAARAETLAVRERVLLETVLALHRLRQIRSELAHIEETLAVFGKILRLYRGRPFLTPEQEVSLASFELAGEDYKLRRSRLTQDKFNLLGALRIATRHPLEDVERFLPPAPRRWTAFDGPAAGGPPSNAALEKAEAAREEAEAKARLARSEAWPDLRLGPTLETESLSHATKTTGGLHFALPLPVLNRNAGGQAYAQAEKIRAESALAAERGRQAVDRESWLSRYRAARKALAQTPSPAALGPRHAQVEAFFEKGLVPSTLVIEIHRQINDVAQTYHEQELAALEALWRLYILEGRAFAEKI